jgi:SAM-dependent methyltransferase
LKRYKVFKSGRIKATENMLSKEISGCRVLEIGAGDYSFDYVDGSKSWIKTDLFTPCDVICDLNTQKLNLPFTSECFDIVICTQVLEHLLWPQQLLKECHRILSKKGKILISVPNIVSLTYRIAWLFGHVPSCAASGNLPRELGSTAYRINNDSTTGGHVIDFNLKKTIAILKYTEFKVIKIKGSGIIWHKQIIPYRFVPVSLSSNIICLGVKNA